MSKYTPCPCCSKRFYHKCCKPFHDGTAQPDTAEQLLRSRFAAFAEGLVQYIMNTTHPENTNYKANKIEWGAEIKKYCDETKFQALEITDRTQEREDLATVTFTAFLKNGRQTFSFTEKSFFVKINGKWLYLDGDVYMDTPQ